MNENTYFLNGADLYVCSLIMYFNKYKNTHCYERG
jgi:hypothetical protein